MQMDVWYDALVRELFEGTEVNEIVAEAAILLRSTEGYRPSETEAADWRALDQA